VSRTGQQVELVVLVVLVVLVAELKVKSF